MSNEQFTMGSLFDGSGGFPLASLLLGITPIWASEVKPYPIAVTKSRLPHMEHLGSITEINGGEIPPVDVITFGSPCQDMSIAGKRAGIKHKDKGDEETTRSGLFLEAVRVIREMREATNEVYPRIAIWENVLGAFSSHGSEDFRCVLEELANISGGYSIPGPPKGKWKHAGEIVGDGWSIAWRVLDAKYWGVAQRRARVFLVACFNSQCAGEILFKRESLRWYSQTRDGEGKAPAGHDFGSMPGSGAGNPGCLSFRERAGCDGGGKGILVADGMTNTLSACANQNVVFAVHDKATRCKGGGSTRNNDGAANGFGIRDDGVMYTLDTACSHAVAFKAKMGAKAHGIGAEENCCPTLSAENNDAAVVYTIDQQAGKGAANWSKDVAPTMCSDSHGTPHAVAYKDIYGVENHAQDGRVKLLEAGEPMPTLTGKMGSGGVIHLSFSESEVWTMATSQQNAPVAQNQASCLTCHHEPQIVAFHQRKFGEYAEGIGTITTSGKESRSSGNVVVCRSDKPMRKYVLRRLMPMECGRLQGFPDGWGIPDCIETMTGEEMAWWENVRKTDLLIEGKKYRPFKNPQSIVNWYNGLHTDSAEYAMWGNGVALPCVMYVMEGVADVLYSGKA